MAKNCPNGSSITGYDRDGNAICGDGRTSNGRAAKPLRGRNARRRNVNRPARRRNVNRPARGRNVTSRSGRLQNQLRGGRRTPTRRTPTRRTTQSRMQNNRNVGVTRPGVNRTRRRPNVTPRNNRNRNRNTIQNSYNPYPKKPQYQNNPQTLQLERKLGLSPGTLDRNPSKLDQNAVEWGISVTRGSCGSCGVGMGTCSPSCPDGGHSTGHCHCSCAQFNTDWEGSVSDTTNCQCGGSLRCWSYNPLQ